MKNYWLPTLINKIEVTSLPIYLHLFGREAWLPKQHSNMNSSENMVIEYVFEGALSYLLEGKEIQVTSGQMIILPKHYRFSIINSCESVAYKYFVVVNGSYIEHLNSGIRQQEKFAEHLIIDAPECQKYFEQLELCKKQDLSEPQKAAQKAAGCIFDCLYSWSLKTANVETRLSKIKSILVNNKQWPSVSELATAMNLSVVQFNRVFKNEFGVSPGNYILELRMKRAADFLTSTQMTIAEIAQELG